MRFLHQALLSLALGLAAATAALWVPLPGGTALDHVLDHYVAIDDLRLVLSVGALAFAVSAVVTTAFCFAAALRELGKRALSLRALRPDGSVSLREWQAATVGTLLEESALIVRPPAFRPILPSHLDEMADFGRSGVDEARAELRHLFWHRIARLQVWTATGILFAVSVLSLVYRRLGLDGDASLVMLILAPAGILAILGLVVWARLALRRSVRNFLADLTGPLAARSEDVLPLTSDMRISHIDQDFRGDPSLTIPLIEREAVPAFAEPLSVLADAGQTPATSTGGDAETQIATVLSSLRGLEAQQRTIAQEISALREVVWELGDRPSAAVPPASDAGERFDLLRNGLAELVVHVRGLQERVTRELTAFAGEMREGRQSHQQALADLTSSFNRLEARLVPILRHVAATNRAMALLSERAARLETQVNKFAADRDQDRASTASVVTPFRLTAPSDARSAEIADMTTELRQLLNELEDAAPSDEPPGEARAMP